MAELISKASLVFALIALTNCGMIYRRYEKEHPTKNYTEIVEIFETIQRPPAFIETDKALNDFLGRDAFRSDMNCTKLNDTEEIMTTTTRKTSSTTTTTTAKSTTSRQEPPLTTPTTTMKTPNLDHLFTIKTPTTTTTTTTRTTIRPNPKENENPDYTELYNWPTPHVQVTKHSPSTVTPPLIVIQETDDRTTRSSTSTTPRIEDYEEDEYGHGDASEDESEEVVDDYDPNNYDLVRDDELVGNGDYNGDDDDDHSEEFDDDLDAKRRRKRLSSKRKRREHKQTVLSH